MDEPEINDLIMLLNGCDYEAAAVVYENIKATGDKELIAKADYLYSVI